MNCALFDQEYGMVAPKCGIDNSTMPVDGRNHSLAFCDMGTLGQMPRFACAQRTVCIGHFLGNRMTYSIMRVQRCVLWGLLNLEVLYNRACVTIEQVHAVGRYVG